MTKLISIKLLVLAFFAISLVSCDDDDDSGTNPAGSSTFKATVSGDVDLGTVNLPANFSDQNIIGDTRTAGASDGTASFSIIMYEGATGTFDLDVEDHDITLTYNNEIFSSYEGTLVVTQYTDDRFVGTFNDVKLESFTTDNEVILTNGSFDITKVVVSTTSNN